MAYCPNCGAPVSGRFCAQCGTEVGASEPGARPASGSAPVADNVASALCYSLGLVTGVLFLVWEPYSRNRNIRFHAFQSIFINLAWFVVMIALSVATFLAALMPPVGLAFFALWIYMIVTTFQGKTTVLPVIGPLAQQQAAR